MTASTQRDDAELEQLKTFTAATDAAGLRQIATETTEIYQTEEYESPARLVYESVHGEDGNEQVHHGILTSFGMGGVVVDAEPFNDDDEPALRKYNGWEVMTYDPRTRDGWRKVGELVRLELAQPDAVTEALEAAIERQNAEDDEDDGHEAAAAEVETEAGVEDATATPHGVMLTFTERAGDDEDYVRRVLRKVERLGYALESEGATGGKPYYWFEPEDDDGPEVVTDGGTDYPPLDGISSTERMDDERLGERVSLSYNGGMAVNRIEGLLAHPYVVREGDEVVVQYGERHPYGGFSYTAAQQAVAGEVVYRSTAAFVVETPGGEKTAEVRFPEDDAGDPSECEVEVSTLDGDYALKAVVAVEDGGDLLDGKRAPVVANFKDDGEIPSAPDRYDGYETPAEAAHSGVSCDECGRHGYVVTHTLDVAAGMSGDALERPVVCSECGE